MRSFLVAMFLVVLPTAVALSADPMPRTVSTTGEAVVNVVPDEVVAGLGVETFAAKLEEAKKLNDERAARLVKAIKAAGVEERHIRTDTLQLEIRYRSNRPSEGIDGYYARRSYSVTLKDPKRIEELLDGALNSGANQILGIDYRSSELRKHRDRARQVAIVAAKEKAVALAAELECTVGAPRTISEGGGGFSAWGGNRMQNSIQDMGGAAAEGAEATPFGQIAITAQVSVTFDLSPR